MTALNAALEENAATHEFVKMMEEAASGFGYHSENLGNYFKFSGFLFLCIWKARRNSLPSMKGRFPTVPFGKN